MNPKKINWQRIITAVLAGLLLFSLFTIASLRDEIDLLRSRTRNLTSELNSLRGEVATIYREVEERMKKEASLLADVACTTGELDSVAHTVETVITVLPKSVTEDMTLILTLGHESVVMTRENTAFTGVIPVKLFEEYEEHPVLTMESGGVTQTEILEDVDLSYLSDRYLPQVHVNMGSSATLRKGILSLDGHLSVNSKPVESGVTFVRYELVGEINGNEISREDLTEKGLGETPDWHFIKELEVKTGDVVSYYVVAEDTLGYVHKALAFLWYAEDGRQADVGFPAGESIYDQEGNLLRSR